MATERLISRSFASLDRFTRDKVIGQQFQLPDGVFSNPLIIQHDLSVANVCRMRIQMDRKRGKIQDKYEVSINMKITQGPAGMLTVDPTIQGDNILLLLMYRDSKVCAVCAKTSEDTKLMKCSRCNVVFYCSKECQKSHWRAHKPDCVEAAAI
jgi:hypothetical protein